MPDHIDGISREPQYITDSRNRALINTIIAANDLALAATNTAQTDIEAVKTVVDAAVVGGVGMDNTATIALQVLVDTAVASRAVEEVAIAAINTATVATGL